MQREPIDHPADALPTRNDHVRTVGGWTPPVAVTSPGLGAHGTAVICSALGVPRQFYTALAQTLYPTGRCAVTFDHRNIGEVATIGPGTPRFADWDRHGIDAVLKWAYDALVPEGRNGHRLVMLGHNVGGQLVGLTPHTVYADALVHVTVSLMNARLRPWRGPLIHPQLARLLQVRIPLAVARVRGGMLPLAAVGMGSMAIPAATLDDWAHFARRRGHLLMRRTGLDISRYPRLAVPLLAWGFDDDPMAPADVIDALIAQLPATRIMRRQVNGAALGVKDVSHMGFFRVSFDAPWWHETVA